MGKTFPAVALGGAPTLKWVATPAETMKLFEFTPAKPLLLAARAYVPAICKTRVLNVATPFLAATVVVPPSVAAGPLAMVKVTLAVLLVITLLFWSRNSTVTAGLILFPAIVLVGCCRKVRWVVDTKYVN